MIRRYSITLLIFFFIQLAHAQSTQKATDVVGEWLVEDKTGIIKIFTDGSKFYGMTVWIKEPRDEKGQLKLDTKNPDPAKRNTPLQGALICKDFTYDGDGVWNNGSIYDSRTGKTYSCKITMKDINTIHLRGFIGVSVLGGTTVWTRKK